MKKMLFAVAAAAVLAAPAAAAPASASAQVAEVEQARIPFPGFRIRTFHAPSEDVVYLQDHSRNWYRADLIGPCRGLHFVHGIGIDTRGSSSFDKFSAIIVGRDRCQLISLTRSDKPERRKGRKKGHGASA
jgi:hypothetical protein